MTRSRIAMAAAALALTSCTAGATDAAVDELLSTVATEAEPTAAEEVATPPGTPADVPAAPPFRPPPDTDRVVVDRVVDGDTLVVDLADGGSDRVRLLRIDTPELSRDGAPAQCLAMEATAQLSRFAGPGTTLLLATDVEVRDRFDRLLAHAWRADDGVWVNGGMLATGFARVVTFPPNTAYDAEVLALQDVARDRGVGLWSRC